MSETASSMLPLGTPAPEFVLPDTEGDMVRLSDFEQDEVLVVAFICNHCPFVRHILPALVDFAEDYRPRDVGLVAINANDTDAYPADAPERMAELMRDLGHPFPYLYDENQATAKAYRAACTPDFFVFDGDRRLIYRGRFDDSSPGRDVAPSGNDLRAAVDAVLAGRDVPGEQIPSMGCNIKWRAGNAPEYV